MTRLGFAFAFLLALTAAAPAQIPPSYPKPTTNTACGVLTRPADTNAYSSGDLIANSTTANQVVVQSCTIARFTGGSTQGPSSGIIPAFVFTTNVTTGWNGAVITINFWRAAPTYTNGDNGAYAVATGAANFLGQATVTLIQFGDGASGRGVWTVGNFASIQVTSGQAIYWDMQVSAALTPISGQQFTLVPEELID